MKNKTLKRFRNTLFVFFVKIIRYLFVPLPWKAGAAFWGRIGRGMRFFFRKESAIALKNIGKVYGEKAGARERAKLLSDNFANYGRGFFEFCKLTAWEPERVLGLVRGVSGFGHFEKARAEKRPMIGVTAHFANWELIPVYMRSKGFNVGVIGKKLFDERLDAVLYRTRTKAGVKVYDKDNVSREMIKGLRDEGLMLGVLVDQDTTVESVTSPFLGYDAKTPAAPAKLAKKFGAVILTLFMVRRPDGYYDYVANEPLDSENMSEQQLVDAYNAQISQMILRHPEQWAWIHDRWKSMERG